MPASGSTETALDLVHQGWDHLRLQRPLAAWASWQRALRLEPEDRAATEALAILEGAVELPISARLEYKFRSPDRDDRREAWSSRFRGRDFQDLAVAAEAFGEIGGGDPSDGAARFNEGLCLAWLGRNRDAIAALDASVSADAYGSPESAVASWMIAEILRQGAGAEALADDLSYSLAVEWADDGDDPLTPLAGAAIRPVAVPDDPATGAPAMAGVRLVEWLDRPFEAKPGRIAIEDVPLVLATVVASPGRLRLSSPDRQGLEIAEHLLLSTLGDRAVRVDRRSTPLPLRLMDAAVWTFRLPPSQDAADPDAAGLRRAAVERHFEQIWIAIPRLGLSGTDDAPPLSPVDASRLAVGGDRVAEAKLAAVVNLREQLSARPHMAGLYDGYPFDRLRRRLGLPMNDPSTVESDDVSSMGRADLDRLDPKPLSDDVLSEAIVAARAVCDPETIARLETERRSRAGA